METYRKTVEIAPRMTLAANNLAWILSTHPSAELRDGTEAVKWAEHVCKQTMYRTPAFLDTLACAYAERGNFDEATKVASRAIQMLKKMGQAEQAAPIERKLELFRSKTPFRDK